MCVSGETSEGLVSSLGGLLVNLALGAASGTAAPNTVPSVLRLYLAVCGAPVGGGCAQRVPGSIQEPEARGFQGVYGLLTEERPYLGQRSDEKQRRRHSAV